MQGIGFTEFLEDLDEAPGPAIAESVTEACDPALGGVCTSVAAFPCEEMAKPIGALAELSGRGPVSILREFGGRLAETLHKACPQKFKGAYFFDFVKSVDSHIRVEVMKLFQDAELLLFHKVSHEQERLVIDYVSSRGPRNLASGLFRGCSPIFDEPVRITAAASSSFDPK